ncbi:MAG TPA: hypothetical protein VFZ65_13870 [Planctomycetota bacterium]|nr:hypothetical protein [Planctomycetota bacterium]
MLVSRCLFVLLSAAVPAQTILVPSPGNPNLVVAVANAPPGSVLELDLTIPHYAGALVDKPLTIQGAGGGVGVILFSDFDPYGLRISALGGGRVVLRNIRIDALLFDPFLYPSVTPPALDINLPATESGSILLDNVRAAGVRGAGARVAAGPAVRVVIRDGWFVGGTGVIPPPTPGGIVGGDGASITASGECLIERSSFFGGLGGHSEWYGPIGPQPGAHPGGRGLFLAAPLAALVDCDVIDGAGGSIYFNTYTGPASPCAYVGPGGMSLLSGDMFDVTVQNGAPGNAPGCSPGLAPPPYSLGAGRQDLRTPIAQLQAGVSSTIDVRIPPAGFTWVAYAASLHQQWVPVLLSTTYVDQVVFLEFVGGSVGGGFVSHAFPFIAGPVAQDLDVFLQTVHLDGLLRLGTPASVTVYRY